MGSEVKVEDGKWRYTWEAQSHIPTLRLLLFPISKTLNLLLHYQNLTVALHSSLSFLTLPSSTTSLSLRVPLPTVLLDADSPPTIKVLADHVKVKRLLPAVLFSLHSPQSSPLLQPLVMENGRCCDCAFDESSLNPHHENGKLSANFINEVAQCDDFPGTHTVSNDATKDLANIPNCCAHSASAFREEDDKLLFFGTARKTETVEILGNQKSFLNGFLEDIFMARSSNLSMDIEWHEFTCPYCTSLLGDYPCCEGSAPVDGGVRLYKCYISTCLPVLRSGDIFRSAKCNKIPPSSPLNSSQKKK